MTVPGRRSFPRTMSHFRAFQLDTDLVVTDYVSADSAWGTDDVLVATDGTDRKLKATTIDKDNVVTAAAAFATDEILVQSDGTGKGTKATSIASADVVTAGSAFSGAGVLVTAGGANKTVQDTSIASTDVVTASSAYGTDDVLIASDGTGKGTKATSIDKDDVVTAASAFTEDILILGAGADKTLKASSYNELHLTRIENSMFGLHSSLVFYESFTDVAASGDLHNTSPWLEYAGSANVWSAHTSFNKGGTMDGGGSGAFIPFTPVANRIYHLELGLIAAPSGGVAGEGLVFGFCEDLPSTVEATGASNWMESGNSTGKALVFLSNDTATTPNQIRLGSASDGFATETTWVNSAMSLANDDNMRVRLILDTTDPGSDYTMTVLAKRGQDAEWVDVSNKKVSLTATDITAVGIATTDTSCTATLRYFFLVAEVFDSEFLSPELHNENEIYHEEFNGFSAQALNGLVPTFSSDETATWQAKNAFSADGDVSATASGAYLDFTPQDGRIYYLDVLWDDISGGAAGFGFAMGFCEGKSSTAEDTGSDAYMGADPTTAKWSAVLVNSASTNSNFTCLGTASSGFPAGSPRLDWTDSTLKDDHGKKWVRLVLDCTYADGTYRGQCFAKNEDDEQWTDVSGVRTLTAQDISAIGISNFGSTTTTRLFEMRLWYEEPKKNTITEETGAGTAYTLTDTSAAINLGTTDPDIVIAEPGEYLIRGWAIIDYNGATYASTDTVTLTIRRTNNTAADLESVTRTTPVMTTETDDKLIWVETSYTTSNDDDAIALYANVGVTPSAGSVDISKCELRAVKLI